jgi:hypothetical protein
LEKIPKKKDLNFKKLIFLIKIQKKIFLFTEEYVLINFLKSAFVILLIMNKNFKNQPNFIHFNSFNNSKEEKIVFNFKSFL